MKILSRELLNTIVSKYGDSFYILDSDVFADNYKTLLSAFRKYYDKTQIAYSYKTNYIPELCGIVNEMGGYAEVVSSMEQQLASRLRVSPERIIWNGPIKRELDIEPFLLAGGTVNIDSWQDFCGICKIAGRHRNIINIGVRCNFSVGDGVDSRFGIDVNDTDFKKIFDAMAKTNNVHLKSLHIHFANRHYEYWEHRTRGLLKIYERVNKEYGLKPEILDLGGGISGPMPDELKKQLGIGSFSYDDYALRAAALFSEYFKMEEDKPYLVIEPGTSVAANCMRYVCRVETIKNVRGKTIITVNGSQKNISMQGVNPPLDVISLSHEKIDCNDADIAGYTCVENDYLYKHFNGRIGVGDYLVLGSCGSYSVVMKPPFIFPNVPIIDISRGGINVIKRAECFEDIFKTYNI